MGWWYFGAILVVPVVYRVVGGCGGRLLGDCWVRCPEGMPGSVAGRCGGLVGGQWIAVCVGCLFRSFVSVNYHTPTGAKFTWCALQTTATPPVANPGYFSVWVGAWEVSKDAVWLVGGW